MRAQIKDAEGVVLDAATAATKASDALVGVAGIANSPQVKVVRLRASSGAHADDPRSLVLDDRCAAAARRGVAAGRSGATAHARAAAERRGQLAYTPPPPRQDGRRDRRAAAQRRPSRREDRARRERPQARAGLPIRAARSRGWNGDLLENHESSGKRVSPPRPEKRRCVETVRGHSPAPQARSGTTPNSATAVNARLHASPRAQTRRHANHSAPNQPTLRDDDAESYETQPLHPSQN